MAMPNDLNRQQNLMQSSRSIRKLLEQRWFVVVLALMLTGLGAALTGVLFKAGIYSPVSYTHLRAHET